jgi:hypothetical protein
MVIVIRKKLIDRFLNMNTSAELCSALGFISKKGDGRQGSYLKSEFERTHNAQ